MSGSRPVRPQTQLTVEQKVKIDELFGPLFQYSRPSGEIAKAFAQMTEKGLAAYPLFEHLVVAFHDVGVNANLLMEILYRGGQQTMAKEIGRTLHNQSVARAAHQFRHG